MTDLVLELAEDVPDYAIRRENGRKMQIIPKIRSIFFHTTRTMERTNTATTKHLANIYTILH